jgi:hypothetical protein
MKIIYTLLIIATAGFLVSSFTSRNYIYYYCHSRTLNATGKTEIRISPVHAISVEDTAGWFPAREWGNWVRQNSDGKEATSDFNYYFSKAEAKKRFKNSMAFYSDTSKYILKKSDFRLNASKK